MKWGTKYGSDYVNKLHSMVQRHLTIPHRFVCFTDNAQGFAPGIESFPLPEMDLPANAPERGWNKLTTLGARLGDLEGTALFLDLDILITDNIDCFFELPGQFCIIHDWLRPNRLTGNSSVYRWEIGAHTDVLEHFVQNREDVRKKHRNEQAYLTARIMETGSVTYWPQAWCRSFKRHCMPGGIRGLWQTPTVPADVKIIVFHGNPNPHDAIRGKSRKRWKFLKPTPWIADHWQ
jgi:hypothetical protein